MTKATKMQSDVVKLPGYLNFTKTLLSCWQGSKLATATSQMLISFEGDKF